MLGALIELELQTNENNVIHRECGGCIHSSNHNIELLNGNFSSICLPDPMLATQQSDLLTGWHWYVVCCNFMLISLTQGTRYCLPQLMDVKIMWMVAKRSFESTEITFLFRADNSPNCATALQWKQKFIMLLLNNCKKICERVNLFFFPFTMRLSVFLWHG